MANSNSSTLSNSPVQLMIYQLKSLKETNSILVSVIQNFPLLIEALNQLDALVEMVNVKESIISQLRFLLMKQAQSPLINHSIFEDHMLHTVIYGPPGVGKTKVGVILAKIWLSLGLLQKPTTKATSPPTRLRSHIARNSSSSSSSSSSSRQSGSSESSNLTLSLKDEEEKGSLLEGLYEKIINKMEAKNKVTAGRIHRLKQHLHLQEGRYNQLYRELEKLKYRKRFISNTQQSNIFNIIEEALLDLELDLKLLNDELINDRDLHNYITKTIADTFIPLNSLTDKSADKSADKSTNKSIESLPIKIVSRADLVAEYLGQTAIKTLNLLQQNIGKVVFIDEAYSLITSDRDSFGMESLTIINQFMSEHPHELVIIFSGYKDLLEKTIFERQPGLKRRCTWVFEINGYTAKGLAEIFKKQLAEFNWSLDPSVDLISFFSGNKEYFPAFGGDTAKLSFYCKLAYATELFTNYNNKDTLALVNSESSTSTILFDQSIGEESIKAKIITAKILHLAFNNYKQNRVKESDELSPAPGIYL